MNNQQEQEERQQRILEALQQMKSLISIAGVRKDYEALDFLASECGVSDQWRKRNGD